MTIATAGLSVDLSGRRVLDDVGVVLEAGSLVGVIGPNGAGKSTFARALLGLVPASGQVMIDGRELATLSRTEIAQRMAYLPQVHALHWPLSVARLVGLGRLPHLGPFSRIGADDQFAIDTAMARTGTLPFAERIATELSGGERARVMLARALATGAPTLIADEPLAALDPGHQLEMIELLAAQARGGALVVVILHDLAMASRFCDRLLLLDRGRLVADGPPHEVLTDEALAQVYGMTAWRGEVNGQAVLVPLARVD